MLYFIPTPIGNKEDITVRALRLMKELSYFLCEDTSTTKKLCNMYDISLVWKEFLPYTSFTNPSKLQHYLNIITSNDVCVLSEAGTPGLSDPGKSIVKLAREHNIPFEVLPGATALIPSIVWAYTDTSTFVYYGFLPIKKWRQTALKEIIAACDTKPHFFYESVHRVEKLLEELVTLEFTGTIYIAREISKMFEQKVMWTAAELLRKIKSKELILKWEFVVGMRR
jgi:16S rRNA (cytidine1402-2'-O)-methyltransferase